VILGFGVSAMRRREFLTLFGSAAAWPVGARAQQADKLPTIGFLALGPASAYARRVEALREGLRHLGYTEGKNIVIEFRWAVSCLHSLPSLFA
jgi:putative ABC transport system substrate-binding protein